MDAANEPVDPRFQIAFNSAQVMTEHQARAALEIATRLGLGSEPTLVGALTVAFATNFAALNNLKAR